MNILSRNAPDAQLPANPQKLKTRLVLASFLTGVLLMSIKFAAYFVTSSTAVLTDALESIINVVASGFAFFSIYLASLPKDKNHPYGHGKIEFFSAGFEGALIMLAGAFILGQACLSFIHPRSIRSLDTGMLLVAVTAAGNGILGYILREQGKRLRSLTIEADGHHLITDMLSSIVLIGGMLLIWITDFYLLDSILSLLMAVAISYKGYQLTRKSVAGLMDEADEETLNSIISILQEHRRDSWIDVHNMRIQKYGSDLHIDCHVTLPYYWTLQKVHDEVHAIEELLQEKFKHHVEIFIHSDPCLPQCCSYCRIQGCPVRQLPKTREIPWNIDNFYKNEKHFRAVEE